MPEDPNDSPFLMAIQQCDGVVVLLDDKATTFKRMWCCYEKAMVVVIKKEHKQVLLDFATVYHGKPELLTEGFARDEDQLMKNNRQSSFPLELMEKAFDIQVEKGETRNLKDRRHLLNSIVNTLENKKGDLDSEPDLESETYDRINRILRSTVADYVFSNSKLERIFSNS